MAQIQLVQERSTLYCGDLVKGESKNLQPCFWEKGALGTWRVGKSEALQPCLCEKGTWDNGEMQKA